MANHLYIILVPLFVFCCCLTICMVIRKICICTYSKAHAHVQPGIMHDQQNSASGFRVEDGGNVITIKSAEPKLVTNPSLSPLSILGIASKSSQSDLEHIHQIMHQDMQETGMEMMLRNDNVNVPRMARDVTKQRGYQDLDDDTGEGTDETYTDEDATPQPHLHLHQLTRDDMELLADEFEVVNENENEEELHHQRTRRDDDVCNEINALIPVPAPIPPALFPRSMDNDGQVIIRVDSVTVGH